MLPEAEPDACGANVIVKGTLCPAMRVTGKVMPLTENPSPLQLPEEIVTAELLAVSWRVRVALLPNATLPKAIVGVETESVPAGVVP